MDANRTYRHYGSSKFDPERCTIDLEPVLLHYFKPRGGLWASPIGNGYFTWKDWCEGEEFRTERLQEHFDFKLKPDSRVMTITSLEDCEQLLPYLYTDPKMIPAFNSEWGNMVNMDELLKDHDAIELIHGDNYHVLHSDYQPSAGSIPPVLRMFVGSFYAWDVDSIVINNPDIVMELKEEK